MPTVSNLFDEIPDPLTEEFTQTLISAIGCRIERIVSRGHCSPDDFWYDQDQDEWVLLVRGAARLRFENGEVIEMTSGSFFQIPAHKRHRVEWTDPRQKSIWLAVHYRSSQSSPA